MRKLGHAAKATALGFFPRFVAFHYLSHRVCYITGDTVEQYELVSSLFGQLWGRIQGPTPELAQCCWIFEALIARFAAPACLHATRTLGLPPLRLAIQWMITAFVEVLEPAELLAFWDLILSYHIEEIFAGRTSLSVHIREGVESGVEKKKKEMEERKRRCLPLHLLPCGFCLCWRQVSLFTALHWLNAVRQRKRCL
ncbi:hypothetical protein C3747_204g49 [Trypanosoma cruzi]|uniref:Rab-GAP TBC domain-containing protein n=1 Tax=Trypanosoma cruzi TaxID=5693 RepID=A0A2V2VXA8_TRYCR|nr:hypothetical protein C3747_204g49 [Trypanosoma cruzi]